MTSAARVGLAISVIAPGIRELAMGSDLHLSLFDWQDLSEITEPEFYPGEHLVVCRYSLLAADSVRKRFQPLAATDWELD